MSTAVAIAAALSTACGGGSGGSNDSALPVVGDGQGGEAPITPTNPVTPQPPNDPAPSPGDYGITAELFGSVAIAYSFSGTSAIFYAVAEFGPQSIVGDDGAIVQSDAMTGMQLTPESEIRQGGTLNMLCTHVDTTSQVVCTLDPLGDGNTLFLFDPLSANGQSSGVFEFCNNLDTAGCTDEILIAPDGTAVVVISNSAAKFSLFSDSSSPDSEATQPYLQYHEQGADSLSAGAADSRSKVSSAVSDALMRLQ